MNLMSRAPGGMTLVAFTLAVILGGGNFLAVRFSNRELPPFWGAGVRFSLAAILFVIVAARLRLAWPRGKQLLLISVYGLLSFAISYALMYWALVRVTAGMAAVVLAMVPLVASILAAVQRLERLTPRPILGGLVALAGIMFMTVGPDGLALPVTGLLAILAAALAIGQSVVVGKRVSHNHPAIVNAVGMLAGAPVLLAISLLAGEQWLLPTQPEVAASVAYLVTFGSVGLFVLVLRVVRTWTVSATSYLFVLFPVVTMLLEAWLADEPLTLRGIAGAAVVMAGVWFGALSSSVAPSPAPPPLEPAAAPSRS